VIILRPDWYHLVALVAVSQRYPVPDEDYADWLLWERTPFPMGSPAQVRAEVLRHYRYDAAPRRSAKRSG
jgi:hypothetical protein